ncbi:MAG: peptidoglycan-binding domain-containing protein [Sediminimonas sp.]|uniref:peptidoglycan-binding domain-containing protein n=1 Tax=Sediminimonas sp. TaxID=2823379 RepID=UPI002870842B|nr:peptidoglycan-binding domain-containing protein [Sediminimonas sp.]MDR9484029.1 peptidoglycan-binding domain-containing protein [Sediminimonas sp.]
MVRPVSMIVMASVGLAGCVQPSSTGESQARTELIRQTQTAPPGAPDGTCWGKTVTPARVETVTEQVMVQPPQVMTDGSVLEPAIYRTETRTKITRERSETWFETLCAPDLTPELIASVQRALKVRGHYRGEAHGRMDARTRTAIRRFQKANGLDTDILTLQTARTLGLAPVQRPGAEE